MSDTQSVIAALEAYIRNETGFEGPLSSEEDLLSAGVLDSFNIVSLALFAQEKFAVELEAEDLVRDNLACLSSLAALIMQRRAERG